MSYTNDWSDTVPIDHLAFNNIPSSMRTIRIDVEQRLSSILYGFTSGETLKGIKVLPANSQASDPGAVSGQIQIYAKTVAGNVEFFLQDSSGNIIQLTSAGKLLVPGQILTNLGSIAAGAGLIPNVNLGLIPNVNLAQIITAALVSGAALTSLPSIPSGAGLIPPANIGGVFGAWDNSSYVTGTAYLAATDGTVYAYNGGLPNVTNIIGLTDASNPPTTARTGVTGNASNPAGITMDVRKGDYWKVTTTSSATVYWLPKGS